MKKSLIYLFFILVISCISSCDNTFDPSGEYFVDIDQPADPEPVVNLSLQDTLGFIIVDDQMLLSYSIDSGDLQVFEVHVYLDSSLIYTGYEANDSFYYDPNLREDGLYVLRIEFATNSGSGSLADKYGAEGFIIYQEWGLINVTNSPPTPLNITGIYPENGQLRINWEPYNRLNFQQYDLRTKPNESRAELLLATLPALGDTSFIDPYFIGGTIQYRVNIVTNDHSGLGAFSTFSSPEPYIHNFEALSASSVRVAWTKCDYPTNFGKYLLSAAGSLQTFKGINDTTAIVTGLPFGDEIYCNLATSPLFSTAYNEYQTNTEAIIWSGSNLWLRADQASYIPANDRLYLSRNYNIYRLDNSTLEILASRTNDGDLLGIAVSANGDYIVAHSYEQIFILDPLSLATIQTIQLQDLASWTPSIQTISVSDTGVLFCAAFPSHDSSLREVFAIDLSGPTLLDRTGMNSPSYEPTEMRINADGTWLVYDYDTFAFDGQQFTLWRNNYNASYITFLPNGNQFIFRDPFDNEIRIQNVSDLSVVMTKTIESPMSVSVDPSTDNFGVYEIGQNVYKIFNLSTGALIKEIPVNIYWDDSILLFDNKVFSERGFIRPIFD